MKENLYYILPMAIIGSTMMLLSVKYGWSDILWSKFVRKQNSWSHFKEVIFWLIGTVATLIIISFISDKIGITKPVNNIPLGITLGIWLGFIPGLKSI